MPRTLVYLAAAALFALHQDWWLWDDAGLVLGFLPAGLAYHVGYSLACALLWFLAVRYAWPRDLAAFSDPDPDA
jgi:hypothetical protein